MRTRLRTHDARALVSCAIGALTLTIALVAGGCGGSTSKQSTPAALNLQREDLVAVARQLMRAQAPVAQEAAATKRVWPTLTAGAQPRLRASEGSAPAKRKLEATTRLKVPALFGELQARSLSGPAAGIAGLFRYSALLSTRGWSLLIASLDQMASGSNAAKQFAGENVGLYIESIYDGNFGFAQIGKKLLAAYEKLGGAATFAATLTQAEVDALARVYSDASLRLYPHPRIRVGS